MSTHDQSECPVCAHDWKTARALRNALAATAKAIPTSLGKLAAQLQDAESKSKELQNLVHSQDQKLARVAETADVYRKAEQVLVEFSNRVREVGFRSDDPSLEAPIRNIIAQADLFEALVPLREAVTSAEEIITGGLTADVLASRIYDHFRPLLSERVTAAKQAVDKIQADRQPLITDLTARRSSAVKFAEERATL